MRFIPSLDPTDREFRFELGSSNEGKRTPFGPLYLYGDANSIASVKATGDISLTYDIDIDANWRGSWILGNLKDLSVIASSHLKKSLKIEATGEVAKEGKKWLGSLRFSPRVIWVGLLPVSIHPKMEVWFDWKTGVTATASAEINLTDSIKAGFVYNEGAGVNWIGTHHKTLDVNLSIDVAGYIEGGLRATPVISIYSVAGPSISVQGYGKGQAKYSPLYIDPAEGKSCEEGLNIALKGGIRAFAGFKADEDFKEFFGIEKDLNWSKKLFEKEWLLKKWYIDGPCADVYPFLVVEGDSLEESAHVADPAIEREYVLKNVGMASLPWKINHIEDSILSITPTSGSIPEGGTQIVTISIDPNEITGSRYRNKLEFVNLFGSDQVSFDVPLGSTERTIAVDIVDIIENPTLKALDSNAPFVAKVEWEMASIFIDELEVFTTTTPDVEDSWINTHTQYLNASTKASTGDLDLTDLSCQSEIYVKARGVKVIGETRFITGFSDNIAITPTCFVATGSEKSITCRTEQAEGHYHQQGRASWCGSATGVNNFVASWSWVDNDSGIAGLGECEYGSIEDDSLQYLSPGESVHYESEELMVPEDYVEISEESYIQEEKYFDSRGIAGTNAHYIPGTGYCGGGLILENSWSEFDWVADVIRGYDTNNVLRREYDIQ